MVSNKNITNHLTNGYSDFVFSFLVRHSKKLNLNNKILDVGCGHYRNLKLFSELGFKELYGIDRNVSNNPLGVEVDFTQGDITKGLPYPDKSFDVVLCNYVLMFIKTESINYILGELIRVCNGYLLIETYPKKSSGTFYEDYSFNDILSFIKTEKEFEILQERNYYEKILTRRKV